MSLAVAAEGVTRRFGRRWALRGVDLAVPRGAVVALLGANGTGKTTLLRVISTLLKPTAGRIEILGHAPATADGLHTGTDVPHGLWLDLMHQRGATLLNAHQMDMVPLSEDIRQPRQVLGETRHR
ncbi:ATP-binding cassette domain-containing protein [Candidatus Palauibacter sp.]|uniref:ATP-binding cassette domain-containing protein n=1 Tax=Candidatus Palauibacter sp. TaxID=3101350 RepID=UPI003AF21EA6